VIRSVLIPEAQPLTIPLVFAVLLHACTGGTLVAADYAADFLSPREPIIDLSDTVEVSLVQLKHTDKMPTRATVAPIAPAPPKESDLTYTKPDAKPQPKSVPDRTTERTALLEQLERQRLMQEAIEGAKTRAATDPDSTATESISTGGVGAHADPELARWMQSARKIFEDEFEIQKLTVKRVADADPGIKAEYNVDFDPETGRVLGWSPFRPSGNPVYDAAVERSIQAVSTIPLPPEKYKDTVGSRLTITFLPP
jgi:outer membrane biosynthesis protein TonB